jgi:hypothetical protein
MTRYFGFAIADGMFPPDVIVARQAVTIEDAKQFLATGEIASCLNASHAATVEAMRKLGLDVKIPITPPTIRLQYGDQILVMSVRGLPRLTEDRHYTPEEIAHAEFVFGLWTVSPSTPIARWEFERQEQSAALGIDVKAFLNKRVRAFGGRISPLLKTRGIDTLDDLTQKTERDISGIPNLGRRYLSYIKEALEEEGLSLKPQDPMRIDWSQEEDLP